MTETLTKHQRNLSALIHASTFSRFFIPLGNFLFPLILWMANKNEDEFADHNGKQALNFQISLLLYSVILGAVTFPFVLGLLPWFLEGQWEHAIPFSHFGSVKLNFDSDYITFNRFIWPVGLAGLLYVALFVVNIVYSILAAIRTSEGQRFEYPLTIKFIRS